MLLQLAACRFFSAIVGRNDLPLPLAGSRCNGKMFSTEQSDEKEMENAQEMKIISKHSLFIHLRMQLETLSRSS